MPAVLAANGEDQVPPRRWVWPEEGGASSAAFPGLMNTKRVGWR